MMNIYLTESDEEAIVDFDKDHKELCKTNAHFQNKVRKDCLKEKVHQQPQALSESVQDLVRTPKDLR